MKEERQEKREGKGKGWLPHLLEHVILGLAGRLGDIRERGKEKVDLVPPETEWKEQSLVCTSRSQHR